MSILPSVQRVINHSRTSTFWDQMSQKYPSVAMGLSPGNPTSLPVRVMLDSTGLLSPSESDVRLLDIATGTGVVPAMLSMAHGLEEPKKGFQVIATDFSAGMVERAKQSMRESGWGGIKVEVMDAQNISYDDNTFTHITCSFGPMIFPEPSRFLQGARRVLAPGGTLAFANWKSVGWFALVPPIIAAIRPTDPVGQQPFRQWDLPWEDASWVRTLLEEHGFHDIRIEEMETAIKAPDMDMLIKGVMQPAVEELTKEWSEDERMKWPGEVNRVAREIGMFQEDGSVSVPMTAYVAVARTAV